MPVTNLMKDIVINTLDEVLKKEKNKDIDASSRDDIIAYVLNRVPPRYVTTERGLLYGILDARYKIQQRIDLLFLIYEAIEKISSRRDSEGGFKGAIDTEKTSYLPHIVGQVLEESTLSVIPDVEVSLKRGNSLAPMVDSDWENPYTTNLATQGHYHFWPLYTERDTAKGSSVTFTLTFRHPRFIEQSMDVSLEVFEKSDFGRSRFIPTVLMMSKESS